jgi:hypothetical protein
MARIDKTVYVMTHTHRTERSILYAENHDPILLNHSNTLLNMVHPISIDYLRDQLKVEERSQIADHIMSILNSNDSTTSFKAAVKITQSNLEQIFIEESDPPIVHDDSSTVYTDAMTHGPNQITAGFRNLYLSDAGTNGTTDSTDRLTNRLRDLHLTGRSSNEANHHFADNLARIDAWNDGRTPSIAPSESVSNTFYTARSQTTSNDPNIGDNSMSTTHGVAGSSAIHSASTNPRHEAEFDEINVQNELMALDYKLADYRDTIEGHSSHKLFSRCETALDEARQAVVLVQSSSVNVQENLSEAMSLVAIAGSLIDNFEETLDGASELSVREHRPRGSSIGRSATMGFGWDDPIPGIPRNGRRPFYGQGPQYNPRYHERQSLRR